MESLQPEEVTVSGEVEIFNIRYFIYYQFLVDLDVLLKFMSMKLDIVIVRLPSFVIIFLYSTVLPCSYISRPNH